MASTEENIDEKLKPMKKGKVASIGAYEHKYVFVEFIMFYHSGYIYIYVKLFLNTIVHLGIKMKAMKGETSRFV